MGQSAEEAKKANIDKMGEPLGELYSALWQSVAVISSLLEGLRRAILDQARTHRVAEPNGVSPLAEAHARTH
jgi:hypothetical protein